MFCKYCGTDILADSVYCNHCGKKQIDNNVISYPVNMVVIRQVVTFSSYDVEIINKLYMTAMGMYKSSAHFLKRKENGDLHLIEVSFISWFSSLAIKEAGLCVTFFRKFLLDNEYIEENMSSPLGKSSIFKK